MDSDGSSSCTEPSQAEGRNDDDDDSSFGKTQIWIAWWGQIEKA
jgi:hypothetical protein